MADDDYSPAYTEDDEDLLKQQGEYAPADPSGSMSAAAAQPLETPKLSAAGPMPDPSALPIAQPMEEPLATGVAPNPRPQWKDYAPPEPHGWAKAGHTLAALNPATNYAFNLMPEHRAEDRYKNAIAEYEAPQREAFQQSETAKNQAQAAKDLRPPEPKTLTPDEQTFNSLLQTVNPDTKRPYTPFEAHQKMLASTQEAKKPPVKDVAGINQRLLARYQVLNPGKPLPPQFSLQPGATEDDYKAIDADLQKVEQAQGTKAQQDAINEMRRQAAEGTAQQREFEQNRQTENDKEKKQAAEEKSTEPVESALNFAETYQQSKHTGPGDEALMEKYFELAKPSSGFRMTKDQMAMLQQARSWMEGTKAMAYHALTGRWFSDEQRNQIIETMHQLGDAKRAAHATASGGSAKGGVGQASRFTEGGKTYNIPANQVEAFRKDHPHATPAQ